MESHGMLYNSQQEKLVISEYGRNVQNLINHAKTIEDLEERQKYVDTIVRLMHQMNPQNKNVPEYRERLWKHAFRIADYELEGIKPPNGEIPSPEESTLNPDVLEYDKGVSKFRHYGKLVQDLVEKAIAMEDEAKKASFVRVIASYMKLAYKTWNREHYVSDQIILDDLKILSDGKLSLEDDVNIDYLANSVRIKRRSDTNNNNRGRSNNKRGRSNNNRRRR